MKNYHFITPKRKKSFFLRYPATLMSFTVYVILLLYLLPHIDFIGRILFIGFILSYGVAISNFMNEYKENERHGFTG